MEYKLIAPPVLAGKIKLPASKSISNRALILNALSQSPLVIQNLSDCDDTVVMTEAFSSGKKDIDIKAAGTAMRFLTAYLSQTPGEWTITGTERMKKRPISILVNALRLLGGEIEYMENEGFPPLKIYGKNLRGGMVSLNGSISSQYISALMMIAPLMEDGLILTLEGDIISKPYIRLTKKMMEDFGIRIEENGNIITIRPQAYKPVPYTVESDWSAASYWYEMVALAGNATEIELPGLYPQSPQGDSKIIDLFNTIGVSTKFTDDGVIISKNLEHPDKFNYNFVNEPDLAQTLAVTCCFKNIPFTFSGLQSLKIKETDRILALKTELSKLGYLITDENDNLIKWNRTFISYSNDITIDTYEDHRMAMSFAPIALTGKDISINDPHVVSKSYPDYWKDLEKAGFKIYPL